MLSQRRVPTDWTTLVFSESRRDTSCGIPQAREFEARVYSRLLVNLRSTKPHSAP